MLPSNTHITRTSYNLSGNFAKTSRLRHLLDISNSLESQIISVFPIPSGTELNVQSSFDLLKAYEEISAVINYYDIKCTLKDISFLGFTDDANILLNIIPEDNEPPITVHGTPTSFRQFYDVFDMTTYAHRLLGLYHQKQTPMKENVLTLLELNTKIMLLRYHKRKTQCRLVFDDTYNYILRGIMSSKYTNYDNNIVIYILLQCLHNINISTDNPFQITSYHITDSTLRIYITRTSPTHIPNVGELFFDAVITNDETGAGKVIVEPRHRFYDAKTGSSFSCLPPSSKALIGLHHKTEAPEGIKQLKKLKTLTRHTNWMAQQIQYLSEIPELTTDIAYSLFKKIHAKGPTGISKSLKVAYKELQDNTLVNTTYTLVEGLNIVTNLSDNIDEKIALEHIYYRLITEIIDKKKQLAKELTKQRNKIH